MMKTPLPSRLPADRTRGGFTLVEVLLALGLTMLVLAAAYSGLILFQNVTVAGRSDAERSQLARAIERRMAADIRCVLFREAEQQQTEEDEPAAGLTTMSEGVGAADDSGGMTDGAGSDSGSTGSSSDGSSSTGSSSNSGQSAEATPVSPQSVGVYGDAATLVLNVVKPLRENASSALPAQQEAGAGTGALRRSDLRRISYFLALPGADGLAGTVANMAPTEPASPETGSGTQGLARIDGDRLALEQAELDGNVDLLAGQAVVIADEVTELRFRYFDGAEWLTEWDSSALNALPRAIEVTLRIDVDRPTEPVNAFQGAPPLSASDLYRFVVALPLSDPTLGLEL